MTTNFLESSLKGAYSEKPLHHIKINSAALTDYASGKSEVITPETAAGSDWLPSLTVTTATVATVGLLIAAKKVPFAAAFRLEEKGLTELAGGIKVKFAGSEKSAIEKIVFKDGRVAEPDYYHWKEYTPKGLLRNKQADVVHNWGDYSVNRNGMLEFKDPNYINRFNADGTITKTAHTDMFVTQGVSADYVREMYSTYLSIDKPLREHLVANGAKFHLGQNMTEMFPHLRGDVSLGAANPRPYEEIKALHFGHNSAMVEDRNLEEARGAFLHETGHEVDKVLGIANSPEFIAAHRRDVANHIAVLPDSAQRNINYFVQSPKYEWSVGEERGRAETAAELFKVVYHGGDEWQLARHFPESMRHLKIRLAPFREAQAMSA